MDVCEVSRARTDAVDEVGDGRVGNAPRQSQQATRHAQILQIVVADAVVVVETHKLQHRSVFANNFLK